MSLRLKTSLGAFVAIFLALYPIVTSAQALLDPIQQPKFVNPLPIAARVDMTAGGYLEIEARQVQQDLGLYDPVTGAPLMTTLWGYTGTYPGPTIVVRKDVPIDIRWTNGLLGPGGPLPHLLPVDTSIHWAMPMDWPECGVPLTAHVHGGHSESASDGLPDSWYTPGFAQTGPGWVKEVLHYDNNQEAGTIWYHDHVLGLTRLNVYTGLAGFYLIRDDNEDFLVGEGLLPTGPYEIEMAFQDKIFTATGALYYPSMPEVEGSPDPTHLPEMFGNVMLVNGKAWPVLDVEPRQYRFRFVDGCDSRFLECFLTDPTGLMNPVPFVYQVGTDDGLLNAPVRRVKWVQGPGERLDLVFDFSNPALWGRTFVLRNTGKTPYPNGDPVDARTTGQIMAFRVVKPLDTSVYPVTNLSVKTNLRPLYGPVGMPVPNVAPRKLILFEGEDEYGRLKTKLGTVSEGAMEWNAPITENPMVNDTEVWEIYNTTEDAHPIHLHLVSFRILDRQAYRGTTDPETGKLTDIRLIGRAKVPPADERGWKDTVIMYPGEVTRIVATFDREGLYVWHCHIVSHEDHEMMRPYYVGAPLPPWPYAMAAMGTGAGAPALASTSGNRGLRLDDVYPNPFNPQVQVRFNLENAGRVEAAIYDVGGRLVRRLANRDFSAGAHTLEWNGINETGGPVGTGVYFLRMSAGGVVETRRLVMIK